MLRSDTIKNTQLHKFFILSLVVIMNLLVLSGCNKEKEDGNIPDTTNKMAIENDENSKTQVADEKTKSQVDGGGNKYKNKNSQDNTTISILVSEDDYYYENASIEFEDIIKMVKEFEGNLTVEISDDEATHKAYSRLIEKLEKLEIPVVEME